MLPSGCQHSRCKVQPCIYDVTMSIHGYSWVTTVSGAMVSADSTPLRQTFRVIIHDPEHHTCWLLASRCQQSRCMVLPLHLCSTVYLPSVTNGYTVKIHRCEYRSSVMTPITWVIDVWPTARYSDITTACSAKLLHAGTSTEYSYYGYSTCTVSIWYCMHQCRQYHCDT